MDLRKIKKLIELVEESGIAELEVRSGEEAVRISMGGASTALIGAHRASAEETALPPAEQVPQTNPIAPGLQPQGREFAAPLSGTFYAAPVPGAAAFVEVGARIEAGQVLCILESMKMMNQIEADAGGVIVAVLVANGEAVEAGQPLFLLNSSR
jgi:acetyl-CoA carboxylase biotin carboxyl carrier protein